MTDTPETLKAALADLTARVAAFEKARVEEEEPPVCSETLLRYLADGNTHLCSVDYQKAASEIRYLRGELARLREGLKVRDGAVLEDKNIAFWCSDEPRKGILGLEVCFERAVEFAREIQRHRALLKDGGAK